VYLSSKPSALPEAPQRNDDPLNYDLIDHWLSNPLGCASEVEFNKIKVDQA
jgi:hypothetical protein